MSSLTWRGFGAAIAAAFLLLATSADAAPPSMTGIWTGKVAQIGREGGYALVLTIAAKGVTTDYPDLGCAGKLTRIGASANYVFYSETITKGLALRNSQSWRIQCCIDCASARKTRVVLP